MAMDVVDEVVTGKGAFAPLRRHQRVILMSISDTDITTDVIRVSERRWR